ncbi:MAG: peptidylprolyl isomerase [Thermodesulfovibrionales bacterium]
MVVKPSAFSEEEAKTYYESNREKYMEPEKIKLREIFIMVPSNATPAEKEKKRKKAAEVMEKIRAGDDFGLLAWDYSEDQYKYKSGEIGYIHKGMLLPEVEKEVSNLKEKETTGIIDSIYGFYIFYLEAREAAKQLDFVQVKAKLIKDFSASREKKAKEQYLSELRSKAVIKRL